MLHQNVKAQGFRVLNEDEIGAVCGGSQTAGGDWVITAGRAFGGGGGGSGGGGGTVDAGFGGRVADMVDAFGFSDPGPISRENDIDGDGVLDDEDADPYNPNVGGTIVVTAQTNHPAVIAGVAGVAGGIYAGLEAAELIALLAESGWIGGEFGAVAGPAGFLIGTGIGIGVGAAAYYWARH
jgi:hypothetical protein